MSKNNKQGCFMTLLDFILVLLTGGLWLIWILIKYLRSNSWAQHSSKTNKNTMRCIVLLFGIRLPLSPGSAHMVAVRCGESASFSSLCLSSSDSLLRPPGALIVAVSPAKRKRRAELDSGNSNRCIWNKRDWRVSVSFVWYPAATYFPGPSPAKYLRRIRA